MKIQIWTVFKTTNTFSVAEELLHSIAPKLLFHIFPKKGKQSSPLTFLVLNTGIKVNQQKKKCSIQYKMFEELVRLILPQWACDTLQFCKGLCLRYSSASPCLRVCVFLWFHTVPTHSGFWKPYWFKLIEIKYLLQI